MADRPNILLITSDQQHWKTLGCLNPEVKTPNLDRLARAGMLCERAYCPNPTCTPTRASIITGLYPSQHGAYSLGTRLPEQHPTLGALLAGDGYQTALIGKAHFQQLETTEAFPSVESYPVLRDLEFWKNFHGPWYGFDHVELARPHADESHVGQHYALWMESKGFTDWRRHFQNQWGGTRDHPKFDFQDPQHPTRPQHLQWSLPEEYHSNVWITERSMARLDTAKAEGNPFFLWASYFDPHPPYLVPEPWASMYDPEKITLPEMHPGEHDRNPPHFRKSQERNPDFSEWKEPGGNAMHGCESHLVDREKLRKQVAVYYGMISFMDHCIGQLLDHLEETGLAKNTLVVFTSDHGHFYGHHGLNAKGPFHYEDLIRVPFLARWPGKIPCGTKSADLVSLVDLAPTFLRAAVMEPPSTMSGVDLAPALLGSGRARDWALVENRHQPTTLHLQTYVESRYKITVYRNAECGELFDLETDPGEIKNLWEDPGHAEVKCQMLLRMAQAGMKKEGLPMPRISVA